jgi:hypothetical protein
MARPARKTVDSGLEGWDAEMDDNFGAILDTPFPPAEYANVAALPSASLYEGCVAWVVADDMLYVERGGSWVPLSEVVSFSTSEQDSGRRWIDGSTIYVKTFNFGALPNSTTKAVAHSITNLDLVIELKGMADDGTDQYPIPIDQKVAANHVVLWADDTNINMDTNFNWSTFDGYVTMYYLKSS